MFSDFSLQNYYSIRSRKPVQLPDLGKATFKADLTIANIQHNSTPLATQSAAHEPDAWTSPGTCYKCRVSDPV